MGDNGSVALEAQKIECQAAVTDIKNSAAMPKCEAHGPLARGVIALLNVNIAQIAMQQDNDAAEAETQRQKDAEADATNEREKSDLRLWVTKALIRLGAAVFIVALARADDPFAWLKGILGILR